MGIWPFGRDPKDVEMVSRVITGQTQSGHRVRGKLTIHFVEPQRQADADHVGDRCTTAALALIREAPDHGHLIGAEVALSAELLARYPESLPRPRHVELAALHVVGDPALSDELRRSASASGTFPAVVPPASTPAPSARAPSSPPAAKPLSATPPSLKTPTVKPPSVKPPSMTPPSLKTPSSLPAATPAAPPVGPPRRRGSSQIRSIQSLLMPPGTPPAAMGQFIAPLVKDSSARMLIGFLRAHDLIAVRGVTIDAGSGEMLANLVPVSDAPPGGYEASRAGEIARWQAALGEGAVFALHREVRIAAVSLARDALARADVMPALADAVIEALVGAAFPEEAGVLSEMARFPGAEDFVSTLAASLTATAGADEDPAAVASALRPLVTMVKDDLDVAAMIIKASSGG